MSLNVLKPKVDKSAKLSVSAKPPGSDAKPTKSKHTHTAAKPEVRDSPQSPTVPSAGPAPTKEETKTVSGAAKDMSTGVATPAQPLVPHAKKLQGWEWYRSIGSPRFVLSPMVGQSELAFRMLCRRHGAQLAYTPMFIASQFVASPAYRKAVWQTCPEDRPLIVQFCSNDPDTFVEAAKMVQDDCDAVDLNLGCPQDVAKRGGYGAFLMERQSLIERMVRKAAQELKVPVTVKVRVFDDFPSTARYCLMLQEAGASMITIHARMRHHREEVLADWNLVTRLRELMRIPVILNGDLWHPEDIASCMATTKVDGYMSAQGILHNPAIFEPFVPKTESKEDKAAESAKGSQTWIPPQPPSNENNKSPPSSAFLIPEDGGKCQAERELGIDCSPPIFVPVKPGQRMRLRRQGSPYIAYNFDMTEYVHPLLKAEAAKAEAAKKAIQAAGLTLTDKLAAALGPELGKKNNSVAPGTESLNPLQVVKDPQMKAFVERFTQKGYTFTPEEAVQRFELAREYLECVQQWPPYHPSMVRRHLFFILFDAFQANLDQFDILCKASTPADFSPIVQKLHYRAIHSINHREAPDSEAALNRPRRRDGTIAPPPWPVGGGGMNVSGGGGGGGHGESAKAVTVLSRKHEKQLKETNPSMLVGLKRENPAASGSQQGSTKKVQKQPAVKGKAALKNIDLSRFD